MNLAEIIDGHDGERVAIISRNRTTTYGELADLVGRAHGGLLANGIIEGDRVAIACSNGVPFVVAYLATLGIGAVAVPLNPTSPAAEWPARWTPSGPSRQSSTAPGRRHGATLDAAVPRLGTVVAADGSEIPGALPPPTSWPPPRRRCVDVEPDHLAALLFTSGTAGAPRRQCSPTATCGQPRAGTLGPEHIGPGDVVYGVIPLYHIYGLNVVLGLTLLSGATLLLVQRFDPATAIETIGHRGVTVVGAPPMWVTFSQLRGGAADAFAAVRVAYSGAAKLARDGRRGAGAAIRAASSPRATASPRRRRSSPRRPD